MKERILKKESEIFVAVSDAGMLVGFVQLYPVFSSTRMKMLWLLNDLFVHPDFRSKGISRKLIEEAKNLCRSTDACSMTLETAKDNNTGNSLYPDASFKLDVLNNYYFGDNN